MNNNSQSVVHNAVESTPSSGVQQHQSDMHPLYPNQKGFMPKHPTAVGAVILASHPIEYNRGREVCRIEVKNRGDRPIQVGSHFHFFEVNRYLEFDRSKAFGKHLNIPATTAIRFEPGDSRQVELVPFAGKCRLIGFNSLVDGYAGREDSPCYYPVYERALRRMRSRGFLHCASTKGASCREKSTDQTNKTE